MYRSDKLSVVCLCLGVLTVFGSYSFSPDSILIMVPIGFIFVFISPLIYLWRGKVMRLRPFFPVLISFTVGSMFVIPQYGLYGADSYGDFSVALGIAEAAKYPTSLPPTPLSFLLPGEYAAIFGVSVLTAAKYLPLLLLPIGILGFYVLVRLRASPSMALLAGLALISVPWHMLFSSWFTKQMLGLPLFLFTSCVILMYDREKATRHRWVPLLLVFVSAVVLTHHLSTASMLLIVVGIIAGRVAIDITPSRIRRLVFTGQNWRVSTVMVVFVFTTVITYWVFKYDLPIVVGISPLVDIGEIGHTGQSKSIPKIYHSYYEWFRVTWASSQYQVGLVGGGIAGALGFRIITKRKGVTKTEILFGVLSLVFVSILFVAINSPLPVTHFRILQWLWLGALPLLVMSFEKSKLKKIGIGTAIVFLMLNLLAFPYYELSMNADPAWDAHEKGFGRYEPDHTAAEWVGEYGTQPVTYSDRSDSVVNLHAPELASQASKRWMFLQSDVSSYYLYVAPIDNEFLSAGAPPPTTHPPTYDEARCLDKIYDNPNREVYAKPANRTC